MSFLPAIKIPIRPLSMGHSTGIQISKKLVESACQENSIVLAQLDTISICTHVAHPGADEQLIV